MSCSCPERKKGSCHPNIPLAVERKTMPKEKEVSSIPKRKRKLNWESREILLLIFMMAIPSRNWLWIMNENECQPWPYGHQEALYVKDLPPGLLSFSFFSSVPGGEDPKSWNQWKGMLGVPWLAVSLREWFARTRSTFISKRTSLLRVDRLIVRANESFCLWGYYWPASRNSFPWGWAGHRN